MRQDDFDRLYSDHAEGLFGFLVYRTGDRVTAEDLLADTFEHALRARRRFDPRRGREKAWLYSIATNLVRDRARRAAVERRALEQAQAYAPASHGGGIEEADEREALGRALGGLSEEELEAVALRYGADLTLGDVARVTGQAVSTVEGRVYRGLRKLRDQLS